MDLCDPIRLKILGANKDAYVIVYGYSRFRQILLLKDETNTFAVYFKHCKQVQNTQWLPILALRNDHGTEFKGAFI